MMYHRLHLRKCVKFLWKINEINGMFHMKNKMERIIHYFEVLCYKSSINTIFLECSYVSQIKYAHMHFQIVFLLEKFC